jgi:hypothetical protein
MAVNQADIVETGRVDDKGRKLVMYAGILARVLKNGALQNTETGILLNPPDDDHRLEPVRNSESARELNFIRWHGERQSRAAAVVAETLAGLGDNEPVTIQKADGYIIGELVRAVLDPKIRLDHRVKAYEFVVKQSGMSGEAPKGADNDTNNAVSAGFAGGMAASALLELLKELQNRSNSAQSDTKPDVIDV